MGGEVEMLGLTFVATKACWGGVCAPGHRAPAGLTRVVLPHPHAGLTMFPHVG